VRQAYVSVRCLANINYSLVHAGIPFLSNVTVHNDSDAVLRAFELQLLLPGFAEATGIVVPSIPAKGSVDIHPLPNCLFNELGLRDLGEPLKITMRALMDGTTLQLAPLVEAVLLPPNAWDCIGHYQALAGFVMCDADAVKEIIKRARYELRRLWKGGLGFVDLRQSGDPRAIIATLKALYYCLQERYQITYELERRSYAADWQLIRFHDEILDDLTGTCIDLALLFAACLESVHRDPLILIVEVGQDPVNSTGIQHAIIGCWRVESLSTEPLIRDQRQLLRWITSGEILILDPTGFSRTREYPDGMSFPECEVSGKKYVDKCPVAYALDIRAARDAGLTPMPLGRGLRYSRSAWLAIYRARREAQRLKSPAISARHLLLGLLRLVDGELHRVLAAFGTGIPAAIAESAERSLEPSGRQQYSARETDDWRAILQCAEKKAQVRTGSLVKEGDLVTALLEMPSRIDDVLASVQLDRPQCLLVLRALFREGPVPSEWHGSGISDATTQ